MKRLVIIEDQTAIREMLVEILRLDANYQLVGEAGDGQAAVQLCLEANPDVCVLDAKLPGLSGVDILRRISKKLPQMRVLVFSGHENPVLVREMLEAGAHGFVEKTAGLFDFKKGLETVANGGTYFGPAVAALLRNVVANPATSNAPDFLTDCEREILQLVAESHSTKGIAAKLDISVKTVDNHRTNLMRKLNLHDVASLTRYALEVGLIETKKDRLKTLPGRRRLPNRSKPVPSIFLLMKLVPHKICLLVACAALLLTGCTHTPTRPDPSATAMGPQMGDRGNAAMTPISVPQNVDAPGLQSRGDGFDLNNQNRTALQAVYFDFDRHEIKQPERAKLQAAKEYLDKNPTYLLLLEGHCDWLGTAEYNLGLGERRANAAKKYLQSIGVAADKMETVSKGSLEASKNADDATRTKDRRVDLVVVNPKTGPAAL